MTASGGGDGGGERKAVWVLGLGYSSKAAEHFDYAAFFAALAEMGIAAGPGGGGRQIAALASIAKAEAAAFLPPLAARLGAELLLFGKAELQAQSSFCLTHSPRAQALYGCGSVAEAAALAGAKAFSCRLVSRAKARSSAVLAGAAELGSGGLLYAPRRKFGSFTLALAEVSAAGEMR